MEDSSATGSLGPLTRGTMRAGREMFRCKRRRPKARESDYERTDPTTAAPKWRSTRGDRVLAGCGDSSGMGSLAGRDKVIGAVPIANRLGGSRKVREFLVRDVRCHAVDRWREMPMRATTFPSDCTMSIPLELARNGTEEAAVRRDDDGSGIGGIRAPHD